MEERECARTPMQWTRDAHGGFSRARRVVRPAIDDPVYGYEQVNVAAQRGDRDSLVNWTSRMLRMRKECPEISWGDFCVLRTSAPEVLALRFDWRGTSLVTLHNFADRARRVTFKVGCPRDELLVSVVDGAETRCDGERTHHLTLKPYDWRWLRVGALDNALTRSTLTIADHEVK
jgi:maltose alpha-D-glucosyltransferase/alpha-amylase